MARRAHLRGAGHLGGAGGGGKGGAGRRNISLEGTQPVRRPGASRASSRTPAEGDRDAAVRAGATGPLLFTASSLQRPLSARKETKVRDLPAGHFL